MAAKGTTNLSNLKKAQILAEKQALCVTSAELAKKHNVSRRTVFRVATDNDPEVLALAQQLKAKLLATAARNIAVGLDRMHEQMGRADATLGEITTATKFSHEILQRF